MSEVHTRESILANVIEVVQSVAAEWDFYEEIGESTRLFADVNWQSVDMVVIAHELQQIYHRTFPFSDFFTSLATRQEPGVSVGELTDFLAAQLAADAAPAAR